MHTDLKELIKAELPFHSSFIEGAYGDLQDSEIAALSEYLQYCLNSGMSIDYLAGCYCCVVEDTMLAQIHFQRTGKYQHTSFEEVRKFVYDEPAYMDKYMHGLAVTNFIWPNHRKMLDFFRQVLPANSGGSYLEIGPGHGYFFLSALRYGSYDHYSAIDVSEKSIDLTRQLCTTLEPAKQKLVDYILGDFLATSPSQILFDTVVMGEVLEHVEQPALFLDRLATMCKPNGFAFVTTCVNSPAIDHIYLFSTPEEVESMISASGFEIVRSLRAPYVGKTLAESTELKLPVNVAYALKMVN